LCDTTRYTLSRFASLSVPAMLLHTGTLSEAKRDMRHRVTSAVLRNIFFYGPLCLSVAESIGYRLSAILIRATDRPAPVRRLGYRRCSERVPCVGPRQHMCGPDRGSG